MTSRERVLAAFAHQEPDRVPAWCGASAEFTDKARRELGLAGAEHLCVRFADDSAPRAQRAEEGPMCVTA
jgi:uroporphyrinogen decarboxylase